MSPTRGVGGWEREREGGRGRDKEEDKEREIARERGGERVCDRERERRRCADVFVKKYYIYTTTYIIEMTL